MRLGPDTPGNERVMSIAYRLESSGVKNVGLGTLSPVRLNRNENLESANFSDEPDGCQLMSIIQVQCMNLLGVY